MELSKTPTNWIVIKAGTSDEYSSIEFALLSLNDRYVTLLKGYLATCKDLKDVTGLDYVAFHDDIDFWIKARTEEEEVISEILTKEGWRYVILDVEEMDSYVSNTVRTTNERLKVYPDGTAFYTAHNKSIAVEYYTLTIPLTTIVNAYESY